jgi:hypothetical protein
MTQVLPRRAVATARPAPPVDRLVEYRRLVVALTTASARRAADVAAAEEAYADGVAAVEAELAALTAAADRAERVAARAAAAVVAVDLEADRLWARLRKVLGWRGALLGDTPTPAEPEPGAPEPAVLLARAGRAVEALRPDSPRRTGPVRPLPWLVVALLPALGAAAAATAALAAGGLVTLGQAGAGLSVGAALRGLGYLAFLAAPFAGTPVAAALAARRGRRLDAGGLALTVVGGMVAASAVALALR